MGALVRSAQPTESSRGDLRSRRKFRSLAIAAIVWLAFTVSLAGWWLYFGLRQLTALETAAPTLAIEIAKHQRMLMLEGGFLISCLLVGGVTLLVMAWQQMLQARRLEDFFLTVSHEIKTPLAAIQLQAEMLREELCDSSEGREGADDKLTRNFLGGFVDKIIESVGRLSLQFENSLFMAALSGEETGTSWLSRVKSILRDNEKSSLLVEEIELKDEVTLLESSFPSLNLLIEGNHRVSVDRRVLRAILNNILQNSVFHGRASKVVFRCFEDQSGKQVRLLITDDGQGFEGNPEDLARPFVRLSRSSGTGLGLFLVKRLVKLSEGEFLMARKASEEDRAQLTSTSEELRAGFTVEITLPATIQSPSSRFSCVSSGMVNS